MQRFAAAAAKLAVGAVLAWVSLGAHAAPDRASAERALLEGRVDEAVTSLRAVTAANPRDGAAHLLLCRALYAQDAIDPAVNACEAAVNNGGGGDSTTQDWMGRAYGRKADHANKLAAFGLARKVKAAFERAVQLDGRNSAAVNDLSEYYIGAPAIVGGGFDKAQALASRVMPVLPASAHRMLAMMAEKQNSLPRAENEFKAAVQASHAPGSWTDLADFYGRHGQPEKAVAALHSAVEADTAHGPSLMDVASILNGIHRDPKLAQDSLRAYLAGSGKSDASPAFKAHTMLGDLLAAAGDKAGARAEYTAALAMAASYAPARKGLQSL